MKRAPNSNVIFRHAYLESRAAAEDVAPPTPPPHLEEWFLHNPVERIVALEDVLIKNAADLLARKKLAQNKKTKQQQQQALLFFLFAHTTCNSTG